ncbi:MAG: type II secretion system GspH family protein [Candidatus Gastranaerophilales bacterium]|nr:type II secretion system GspH family protein [Candidatus Gastranaerophilales bacterium]
MKKQGFTLAEVLISLVVIGIIAAITVPLVMENYRRHEIGVKSEKVYSMLSQAVKMAEIEHGIPSAQWNYSLSAGEFFKTYLSKYISGSFTATERTMTGRLQDGIKIACGGRYTNYYIINVYVFGKWSAGACTNLKFSLFSENFIKAHSKVKPLDSYFRVDFPDANVTRASLKNACVDRQDYCSALIMMDGFEIKKDFPRRFGKRQAR